ncbi:MAG: ABC transporter ATP-binding protein [Planctomycetota bacterium]
MDAARPHHHPDDRTACATQATGHIAQPAIELRDVAFSYPLTPVLADVNLAIPRGDFACVVGPNGGGKTTLLKLILGLLSPERGSVRVFGQPPVEARPRIGYMPQHAHLDPHFPVRAIDVVLMARLGNLKLGPFRKPDRAKAAAALAEVGLADKAARSFSALSGGQRQRVLIARALASDPDILLMDEPTANLDPLVQDEMHDLLRALNQRLTIMLVSHDVGFVARYVKSVICVNRTVHVHCATDITGESIRELYGQEMRIVQHGHYH